jgi:hypothetical protein
MKTNTWKLKLDKAQAEFNLIWNDSRANNLGFCAGGNMSRASSHYRDNHRNKIGNKANDISYLKRAVKMENSEPFTLREVENARLDIMPTPPDTRVYQLMPILECVELIRKSFNGKYKSALKQNIYLDFDTIGRTVHMITPDNKISEAYDKEPVNQKVYKYCLKLAKKDKDWAESKNKELDGKEWTEASEESKKYLNESLTSSLDQLAQKHYIYLRHRSHAFEKIYGQLEPIDKNCFNDWFKLTGEKPYENKRKYKIIF